MKKNDQKILSAITGLIDSLVTDSPDDIIVAISNILRRPCVLFSPNLQMIAAADCERDRPPLMDTILELGYHPDFYELSPRLLHGTIIIRDEKQKLHTFNEKKSIGGEVFAPIIADNITREIIGFLYFYDSDKNALQDNKEYLAFICHSLSWRMWKYTHSIDKSNALLTDILCNVLDGAVHDDDVIRRACERAKIRYNRKRMLFVISSQSNKLLGTENPIQRWSDLFRNIWSEAIAFMYNGDLILIIPADEPEDIADQILPEIEKHLTKISCFAGHSEPFDAIDHYLLNYYTRALAAVQTAAFRDDYCCLSYEEVAMEHILRFGKIATSRAVCDPRLLKLLNADQSYSTNYVETLRTYWHSDSNVQQTCKKLHIQRSTFFYRLKKLKEFLGDDFQSHKQYMQYNISLSILEKLGEL